MAQTHIRIRIGASLDSSVDTAFASLRSKAQRAGQQVARELSAGMARGSGMGAGGVRVSPIERQARQAAQAHAQAMRMIERQERERTKTTEREARRASRAEQHALMERLRTARMVAREQERLERQNTRNVEREARAQARARARTMDRFATRTSHRASRFFWPNAPVTQTAKRVGMDVLRGAGVETNLAGIVGNIVKADDVLRSVAIQAYQPGAAGAAGKRADLGVLKAETSGVAEQFAMTREEIAGGLKSFVDMRGNLQGARDLMSDMAKLAKSQSADFTEVMHTAAKIDSALASQKEYAGDQAKTYATIRSIMKGVVYQGKIGSITIEEMAKQIPKLSGIAAQFGGDAGRNILALTTATQLAERGPAKNAATAATYVQSLALDLPKRASVIEGMTGRSIFGAGGKMRGLDKIIEEMLWNTQGTVKMKDRATGKMVEKTQVQQLQAMLPNKRSFLALQEFLNVFQGAGGGKAGLDAVREEFKRNFRALSDKQMTEDLAIKMDSVSSKAAQVNERFARLVDRGLAKAVPALEQLEGPVTAVAGAMSDLFTWAAKNPFDAIVVALAGATVRSAIESTFRASIEAAIYRGTGAIVTSSAGASAGLTNVGTQAGFASAGLARAAAVTLTTVGAVYALGAAAQQARRLWEEIHTITPGDLGRGTGADYEDPESEVGQARAKAKGRYVRAAEHMERGSAEALWGAVAAGPGGGAYAGAAMLRVQGEVEGMRAARAAVGEGKSSRVGFVPWDVSKTAGSTDDVMAKLDPRNWAKAAQKEEHVGNKLDNINATLQRGIRISNLSELEPKGGGGSGVDDSARDVE